jgi:hypothetical protein
VSSVNANCPDNGQQLLSTLLRAAHTKKQVVIAEALEWDKGKVSRVLSLQSPASLDDVLALIAACDLALIPAANGATVTVPAERYQALLTLAGERMDTLQAGRE